MFDFSQLEIDPTPEQILLEEKRDSSKASFDDIRQIMVDCVTLLGHPEFNSEDLGKLSGKIQTIKEFANRAEEDFMTFSRLRRNTISAVGAHDIHFICAPLREAKDKINAILQLINNLKMAKLFSSKVEDLENFFTLNYEFRSIKETFLRIEKEYKQLDSAINNCSPSEHRSRLEHSITAVFGKILGEKSIFCMEKDFGLALQSSSEDRKIMPIFQNPIGKILINCTTTDTYTKQQKELESKIHQILPDLEVSSLNSWTDLACDIHSRKLCYQETNQFFVCLTAWQLLNNLKKTAPLPRKKAGRPSQNILDYISLSDFKKSFTECLAKKDSKMGLAKFAACYLLSLLGSTYYGLVPSFCQCLADNFTQFSLEMKRQIQRHVSNIIEIFQKCSRLNFAEIKNDSEYSLLKSTIENIQTWFKNHHIKYTEMTFNYAVI